MDPESFVVGHGKPLLRHPRTSTAETGNHWCTA